MGIIVFSASPSLLVIGFSALEAYVRTKDEFWLSSRGRECQ